MNSFQFCKILNILIPAYIMLIGTLIFWNWYKLSPDRVTENQLKVIELGL